MSIPFNRELDFEYGQVDQLSPLIRRVVAKNSGPFTLHGTGTYIIGSGDVAIIDPGPFDRDHIKAVMAAVEGETITHLLITHTHNDHSPGCAIIHESVAVPTYGYGPHGAGKLEQGVQVEEGGDMAFSPDIEVKHGDVINGNGWTIDCLYTPGHTSNHVCYALREERALFTGDHVMGWSTTIISPPDGDMAEYMASLDLLLERDDEIYWPTHGPAIKNVHDYVRAYISHRHDREAQILSCVDDGVHSIVKMVPIMYAGLPSQMYPAAARSVFAAVIYMVERGVLTTDSGLSVDANYARA
ncbi:MAG: MBL fold metallo-hydrolase [Pseudomonadota bacterium]